ncbi:MAG: site-specific DNA-methyltransferase [Christensenellaceae bacterium]|jgi:adenine-specific DNA-methyltransferase|nr:site-specific DNA-methyltransferase [Christensenellaceae bacterium]
MEKLKMQSENLVDANIEKMTKLFPNCVTEDRVDFDLLRQELSSVLVEGKDERYRLDWAGKRQAILTANSPIAKTLRPCRGESVNFDTTENLYIEGDNLDVLKLLHETYLNKVKMIYIDPPYNTGNDFIYNDDFAEDAEEYLTKSKQKDDHGNRLETNKDTSGRYHSDWLSMIYMRLRLAKDLLSDDGVIFISIGNDELINLGKVCDEIFGTDNYIGILPRVTKKAGKNHSGFISDNHDYIIIYAKRKTKAKFNGVAADDGEYLLEDEYVSTRGRYKLNQTLDYDSLWYNSTMDFAINVEGKTFYPGGSKELSQQRHAGIHNPKDWVWRWSKGLFEFGYKNGFVVIKQGKGRPRIYTKTYLNATIKKDGSGNYFVETAQRETNLSSLALVENQFSNDNAKKQLQQVMDANMFDFPKPITLIEQLIELVDEPGMIVMDFFSGSATTGHTVMQKNIDGKRRKYILVQLPEKIDDISKAGDKNLKTICDLAKERLKVAGKKIAEANRMTIPNLDIGFRVLKLDDSNMREVFYNPKQYDQSMILELVSSIKDDRTAEDVLFQVMLDKGVSLSSKIEKRTTADRQQTYYIVGTAEHGVIDLICCLDEKIDTDAVKEIARLSPKSCVFLESGMKSDATRTNVQQVFDTYSAKTKVEVI